MEHIKLIICSTFKMLSTMRYWFNIYLCFSLARLIKINIKYFFNNLTIMVSLKIIKFSLSFKILYFSSSDRIVTFCKVFSEFSTEFSQKTFHENFSESPMLVKIKEISVIDILFWKGRNFLLILFLSLQ